MNFKNFTITEPHLKADSKELQSRNLLLHFSQRFSVLALERQAA